MKLTDMSRINEVLDEKGLKQPSWPITWNYQNLLYQVAKISEVKPSEMIDDKYK